MKRRNKLRIFCGVIIAIMSTLPLAHADDDPTNFIVVPDPTVFVYKVPTISKLVPNMEDPVVRTGRCSSTDNVSTNSASDAFVSSAIEIVNLVDVTIPIANIVTPRIREIGGLGACANTNEAGGDPGGSYGVDCWAFDHTWKNKTRSGAVAYAFRMQLGWCGDGSKITEIRWNNALNAGGTWAYDGSSTADTGVGQSTSSINDDWRYHWSEYGAEMVRNPRVDATIDAFGRLSGTVYWG